MTSSPFPPRIPIPADLYRALVQNQIDYYATQGNVGDYWTFLAETTVAASFCPMETSMLNFLQNDEVVQQHEAQADTDDERSGDWTR